MTEPSDLLGHRPWPFPAGTAHREPLRRVFRLSRVSREMVDRVCCLSVYRELRPDERSGGLPPYHRRTPTGGEPGDPQCWSQPSSHAGRGLITIKEAEPIQNNALKPWTKH